MTLAALSPLCTWWPLALAVLLFIVKVICPRVVRRQSPPAELVAAISGWPPPTVVTISLPHKTDPYAVARQIQQTLAKQTKGWPPPNRFAMRHSYNWNPTAQRRDLRFAKPPKPWTRVA